jgi:riboflavin synthase
MFTGIVEEIGTIKTTDPGKLVIGATKVLEGTQLGDSLAVNGVCLTVTSLDSNAFSCEVMPETLRRSNLWLLHAGDRVNLERALALGGRLGGHLVQGHVDATGKVMSMKGTQSSVLPRFAAPPEVLRYVVEKGFIAVDGVSLTVTGCDTISFEVSLVGYTLEHTILGQKRPEDVVNLEVDILAKYVEQLTRGDKSRVTLDLLAEHGFLSAGGE